jgi:endonuclease YncB( thermonuclease family)
VANDGFERQCVLREGRQWHTIATVCLQVRTPGGQQSPFYDDLVKAQSAAEERKLGVHGDIMEGMQSVKSADGETACSCGWACVWRGEMDDAHMASVGSFTREALQMLHARASVRPAPLPPPNRPPPFFPAELDAAALVQRVGKGRPISAIVEAVITGSMLRVTLLPDLQSATVLLAGVQCPAMGRRAAPAAAAAAANGAAGAAAGETPPEPCAREARHYVETRALQRECRLVLEGMSQYGMLVGSVSLPVAPAAPPPAAPAPAAPAAAAPKAANGSLESSAEDLGLGLVSEDECGGWMR